MTQQTGIRRDVVVAFLTTLEKLAKAGTIDQKYWSPDRVAAENKQVTARQKQADATKPKGPVDDFLSSARSVGTGIMILGGLAAAAYLVPYFKRRK